MIEANAKVRPIHEISGMLQWATDAETSTIRMYNGFEIECGTNADIATKKLFEDLVLDEERHFGWFNDEGENVERFGQSYLAQQVTERSKAAAGPPGAGLRRAKRTGPRSVP